MVCSAEFDIFHRRAVLSVGLKIYTAQVVPAFDTTRSTSELIHPGWG